MAAGTLLANRYQLVRQLGAGGFGSVWRARDTTLLRDVAVKLIELDADIDPDTRDRTTARFRREAQAVAGLNHPNVVAAYDFGVSGDTAYLVMELVEGQPLSQIVRARYASGAGALDIPTVLRIVDDVCRGLGAAHRAGIVHRDLKPANLMVLPVDGREIGQVKIVDFGIARMTDRSKLTRTGSYMGTLPYIAPEQMTNHPLDGRADVYALGCLMFELLTGRSAYDADTPVQWLAAHRYSEPYALADLRPDAPPALDALVRDMLAKEPDDRPPTVDAVRQRAEAIGRDLMAPAPEPVPPPRPAAIDRTLVEPIPGPATPEPAIPAPAIPGPAGPEPAIPGPAAPEPAIPAPAIPEAAPAAGPQDDAPTALASAAPPPVDIPRDRVDATPPDFSPRPDASPGRRRALIGALVGVVVLAGAGTAVAVNLAGGSPGRVVAGPPASTSAGGPPSSPSHPVVVRTTPECQLKIAYVGTENSTFATRDRAEYQGMQLALAQYDAAHPDCPVTPARFDTNPNKLATPGVAVSNAAAAAVQDARVVGVIGPSSSTDMDSVMSKLVPAGLPEISPSANNDDLVTRGWTVFHRATGRRGLLFDAMAAWIKTQAGAKVYAVDDTSKLGVQMTATLRAKLGAAVVGHEQVAGEGQQTNYSGTVGRVVASGATMVAYGGYQENAGHFIKQLRNAGYQGMFLVHDFVLEPPFNELAGAAADGTKVFCACTDSVADATPATNAFNLAFFKMFGTTPGLFANTAYDVTNMMLAGVASGATSRRALNTWLGTHSYQGLTSSYRFTPNGELDPSLTRATVFTVGEIGEQNISGGVTG